MSNNEKQTPERDGIGTWPVMTALILIVFSCVLSFIPSPWGYILLIPAIWIAVTMGWNIATKGGRE